MSVMGARTSLENVHAMSPSWKFNYDRHTQKLHSVSKNWTPQLVACLQKGWTKDFWHLRDLKGKKIVGYSL